MKRKILIITVCTIVLIMLCVFGMSGCSIFGSDSDKSEPGTYTIQYTDDMGLHQISVTEGELYNIETIPEREGYTFDGLYSAEVGGTQYVSAKGLSVSAFTDNKNMVLYPRFTAKSFTVILDYQGAPVVGNRQITVSYNSSLPELPKTLELEHQEFLGWYTEKNCGGTQIADPYGLVPVVSVVNNNTFDLSGEYIYLYAGFTAEKVTVTCCFESGIASEDIEVEYGTPVSQVVPETRVDGKVPLTWSKTRGGEVFSGKITEDVVLYAIEYAPVIEFDTNGGEAIVGMVARAGTVIALPTPVKARYAFNGWYTNEGVEFTKTTMPSQSLKLIAKWNPMLIFNERGGEDVSDVSGAPGDKITLPETTKDGYIFAGWYTEDGEAYDTASMPENSINLEARYYKVCEKTIVCISENEYIFSRWANPGYVMTTERKYVTLDLTDIYQLGVTKVKIAVHYTGYGNGETATMYWYSKKEASDAYKLWVYSDSVVEAKNNYEHTTEISIDNGKLYATFCSGNGEWTYWSNMWVEVEYPDYSQLY